MMIILVTGTPYDKMPDGSYVRNSVHTVAQITGLSLKSSLLLTSFDQFLWAYTSPVILCVGVTDK